MPKVVIVTVNSYTAFVNADGFEKHGNKYAKNTGKDKETKRESQVHSGILKRGSKNGLKQRLVIE